RRSRQSRSQQGGLPAVRYAAFHASPRGRLCPHVGASPARHGAGELRGRSNGSCMNESLFDNAWRLHLAGQLNEAAKLSSDVLRTNPRHFEALYRLGAIHFQNGRYGDAEYLFRTAIKLDAQVPEALYSLGCALQNQERHEEALSCFARALALRPG